MPGNQAFVTSPNADGDSNALESDLDSFQQFQLPNGDFVVVGSGPDLDTKLGNSDQVKNQPTDTELAEKAAEAEAALSQYAFGEHTISFQDIYEHPTLDVRTNEPISVNGLSVQEDDAQYRETSQEDWTERFSFTAPETYSGSIRFSATLSALSEGIAHVRVLRDGEAVFSEHTNSETGIEVNKTIETVGSTESTNFKVEIRVVDPSIDGNSGVKARLESTRFTPEFEYDGEQYWLGEVNRKGLPTTEFKERVGL